MSKIAIISACLTLVGLTANAETMRCKNKLVILGNTTTEVKLKCGQPFDVEQVASGQSYHSNKKVERYTYISKVQVSLLKFWSLGTVNFMQ